LGAALLLLGKARSKAKTPNSTSSCFKSFPTSQKAAGRPTFVLPTSAQRALKAKRLCFTLKAQRLSSILNSIF